MGVNINGWAWAWIIYHTIGVAVWVPCEWVWNQSRVVTISFMDHLASSFRSRFWWAVLLWPINVVSTVRFAVKSRQRRPVMSLSQRQRLEDQRAS